MNNINDSKKLIEDFVKTLRKPNQVKDQTLFTGVDLGTSYIVLAVLDENKKPVIGISKKASVVRDGMVVDYIGAIDSLVELKDKLEKKLGDELIYAAGAIPPGTEDTDHGAVKNVIESAGFLLNAQIDEPSAANHVLNLNNGAIVDIGGGTTGVSIIQDGKVVKTSDEATGGTHFSLVVAGALGIDLDEAEEYKMDIKHHAKLLPIIKPVIDKVSTIIDRSIQGYDINEIILVGGSSSFTGIEEIIEKNLGIKTIKPVQPRYVTPIGIAIESVNNGVENI